MLTLAHCVRRSSAFALISPQKYSSSSANGSSFVTFESDKEHSGVGIIRLSRPESLNALNVTMGDEFRALIGELTSSTSLRAVVLTGEGRAFSAGGDLDFLRARGRDSHENNVSIMRDFYSRFLCLRELPVPVIAALNGPAVGAGLCIALACDYRVAGAKVKMGLNFAKLGLHPGMAATHTLPIVAGPSVAADLLFSGRLITGREALDLGVVNEVIEEGGNVLEAGLKRARSYAAAGPVAARELVKTLRAQVDEGLEEALAREAHAQAICYATKDLLIGVEAVAAKEDPVWTGE